MGIEIKIAADSVAEAQLEMEQLLHGRHEAPISPVGTKPVEAPAPAVEEKPAAEPETPKRKRRTKAEIEADKASEAAASTQAISQTPEDRRDPEQEQEQDDVEDAEEVSDDDEQEQDDDQGDDDLIGGFAVTGEGLMAAMQAHAAKFGIEETQRHGPVLFGAGFAKRSDVVAAGEDAIAAALRNFTRAIATGKAAG